MSCSIVVILVVLKDLSGRGQEFGLALWIVFLWGWGGYKGVWYIGYTRVVYHLYKFLGYNKGGQKATMIIQ